MRRNNEPACMCCRGNKASDIVTGMYRVVMQAAANSSVTGNLANVINGIKGRNISIVLQHDIKKFSVDAVEANNTMGLIRRIYIPYL